ncbi:MAG: hypothetical protein JWN32_4003 [Solirubrobacterales bacterium]|nr:hypothetical protein [Solirubrobacterales bacterium]
MSAERAPRQRPPGRQPSLPVRVLRSFTTMSRDQRLAAFGALGLFVSLFLPWYEETRSFAIDVKGKAQGATVHQTHTAISVFTFVEAAELLTAGAVLFLLFARAEGRAFHLPGGDGTMVTAAGAWALLLVVWRFFDKPNFGANSTAGLHWGILGPLAAASVLLYAGQRIRIAHRPEPPLPGDDDVGPESPPREPPPRPTRRARQPTPADEALTMPLADEAEEPTEVAEPRRRRAQAPPRSDRPPPRTEVTRVFDDIPTPDEPPQSPDELEHRPPPPPGSDQLSIPLGDERDEPRR